MAKPKKIVKRVIELEVTDLSPYELDGTLEQVKKRIEELIEQYGAEARLSWDADYWPQYQDSPSPRYDVKISREETDAEYEDRIRKEQEQKDAIERRERADFERLQKKFGSK